MNKEINYLITSIETKLDGEPWFGRSVYELLAEVDPSEVYIRPAETGHSLAELIYHMNTWAQFTLNRLNGLKDNTEEPDWREIDQKVHTWKKGVARFKEIHKEIIFVLKSKDDKFLSEKVDYREYNFRFLIHGLIQHNIYHIGQIAYVKKLLPS